MPLTGEEIKETRFASKAENFPSRSGAGKVFGYTVATSVEVKPGRGGLSARIEVEPTQVRPRTGFAILRAPRGECEEDHCGRYRLTVS